jgi:4,5-dihydroxyphthalate decarboxylase
LRPHTRVLVRTDRGIETPGDLRGKRVGVPEFQQTAAVWTRSVLRSEFGVDPRTEQWFMERGPDRSHGGQTNFAPPPGIDLPYVPEDKNLGQMLVDGELDALSGWIDARNLVDRSGVDPRANSAVRYLFDQAAEAKRFYAKTNIFPINHCVVVRRSIVERYPWVVLNLYAMFEAAKARSAQELSGDLVPYLDAGVIDERIAKLVHHDVLPYGVKRSRHVLETITAALVADGLTHRQVGLDEIFAPNTLDF